MSSMLPGEAPIELSVVMPCLDEAGTLAACVETARRTMEEHGIPGEVIVADNGSALLGGIAAARGKYVLMGDADESYDFSHIPRFLEKLREGNELVIGNRFRGGIAPGAMPPLHRYLGNPVLSALGRLFFCSPCGDFHCGMRAFEKTAIDRLGLRTTGMEFASEMIAKATKHGLRIAEVPTTLSPDGRDRPPHLRSWRDGWRHLRFMLLYSPRWLFLYPGLVLMSAGALVLLMLVPGPVHLAGITFDIHTMLFAGAGILIGYQAVLFSAFSRIYAITAGLEPEPEGWRGLFQRFTLERGLLAGSLLLAGGILGTILAIGAWGGEAFGDLVPARTMRVVIPSVVALTLGCQTILSSFFLSVMGLARR